MLQYVKSGLVSVSLGGVQRLFIFSFSHFLIFSSPHVSYVIGRVWSEPDLKTAFANGKGGGGDWVSE